MMGLRVIVDPTLLDTVEDWSKCRSPSRARRRWRRGIPQRMTLRLVPKPVVYRMGDTIVGHPDIVAEIGAGAELIKAAVAPPPRSMWNTL